MLPFMMNQNKNYKTFLLTAIVVLSFVFQTAFFNFGSTPQDQPKPVNLENIKRISRSTYLVQHEYYDSARINPLQMLKEGFYELAKEIPEVLPKFEGNTLKFYLGNKSIDIDVSNIQKLYDIFPPISEAFDFLKQNYKGESKFEDMEYAFIGGMLAVLDPHSNILPPKVYEEFKTQTQGEYGGLGIVIGIKDRELTVISPIEDTPAAIAGILADDKIMQIDGQSTTNMGLNEAVDLMRGPPKTKVTLHIKSKNRDPRDVILTREIIVIKSVVSHLIKKGDKNFGVLRLKGFQEDTFADIVTAMDSLNAKSGGKLDGLIMDLRNNPGGLLDQAILIADKFLESGDIVYTVGADNVDEEVAIAKKQSSDTIYPMVVLINEGSASASEIVAGALRNNDRAIVLGRQSFGKGSVQSLFSLRDGSSLKLTVAQYLTPGRESIQAVGINPHVHVFASAINDKFYDLLEDIDYGEEKLDAHLNNPELIKKSLPDYTLTYLNEEDPEKEPESNYTSKIKEDDFLVQLGLKVLDKFEGDSAKANIARIKSVIDAESEAQDKLIIAAMAKRKIDWTTSQKTTQPKLTTTYEFLDANNKKLDSVQAGTELKIRYTITNTGTEVLNRVITDIDSLNPLINHKEFVFGKIAPGETKSQDATVKVPAEIISFTEDVRFETYTEKTRDQPISQVVKTIFTENQQPQLAFSYKIIDGGTAETQGNSNGIPEAGEKINLEFSIKNLGPGVSKNTMINIKNTEGKFVFLKKARGELGELQIDQSKSETLSFEVKPEFDKSEFTIDFFAIDDDTKANISDTLKFKISPDQKTATPQPEVFQIAPKIIISENILTNNTVTLAGVASSPTRLKDIAIFVKGRKMVYINLENGESTLQKDFKVDLPLEDGINPIIVQARNERDINSQKTLTVVYRKDDPQKITSTH